MEEFREKLKFQNLLTALCCFILSAFSVLSALSEADIIPFFKPVGGDSHWQSMWRGFVSGAAFALLACMIFGLIRSIRALRNEKYLKKLYVESNDERAIQVWTSARAAAYQVFLIIGIVAAVVSGYFSMTVSVTIIVCITAAAWIGLGFKVYYNRKY